MNSNNNNPTISLSISSDALKNHSEGYSISCTNTSVAIQGNDERGVLYGVGRLLRLMNMTFEATYQAPPVSAVILDCKLANIVSWPQHRMRGHQLGYRQITNSYDGWSAAQFAAYVFDLTIFGTNAVEMIPWTNTDPSYSPHYVSTPQDMLVAVSDAADQLDVRVSLWYAASYGNYSDPAVLAQAVAEWSDTFASMRRMDMLFVPGGDPGGHSPDALFAILRKQAEVLRQYHPRAEVWVSPQGFNHDYLARFVALIPANADYLTGTVYGPWTRVVFDEYADMVAPYGLPIRNYPDITHSLTSELPVPRWDYAFAFSQGRETINPRPKYEALIANYQGQRTVGFGGYSEGCNDDVNKCVWSAVSWGPDQPADGGGNDGGATGGDGDEYETSDSFRAMDEKQLGDFLANVVFEYAKVFTTPVLSTFLATLIFGLEANWDTSPQSPYSSIDDTFDLLQFVELFMTVRDQFNWRLLQIRYRVYYDKIIRFVAI